MTRFSVLDFGRLECDLGWQIAMPAPSTMSDPNPPRRRYTIPVMGVLIESGDHLILFDTGCHPDAMHGRWYPQWADYFAYSGGEGNSLTSQVRLAGYELRQVTDVVLSHLHMDHSGNVGLVAHARVWISRREIEFALAERLTAADYVGPYVTEDWLIPGLNWRFIYGPAAVTPEVEIVPMAGHSPGIVALQVRLEGGWYIFTSDAVYEKRNMGPPPCAPGVIYDSVGFRDTVDRLCYLRDKLGANLVFAHDPVQFESLRKAPYWYA
jgi:N-acyl homoserine lactone hydrolase